MKCLKCGTINPAESKYCVECGGLLNVRCPQCLCDLPLTAKYCNSCGLKIEKIDKLHDLRQTTPIETGERKYVTVLFSDMSGYVSMADRLDPEEVKEIMSHFFGDITRIVFKYEGFVEKFIGDAVMALFGVPDAHEDDPVRAIKAARDIHEAVSNIYPKLGSKIGRPLSMHTGISTGLVVTGKIDLEKGTHGALGPTINLASRLSVQAKPGEIVTDYDTYHRSEGHFLFDTPEPTPIKGKQEQIRMYRVLSPREEPTKVHRLSGLRSELIGRKAEMDQLMQGVEKLRNGKGSIISIVGDAGTGKSRLLEEFKGSLDRGIIFREAHAYAYSCKTPYWPIMNFLSKEWQIQESDSFDRVREKVESGSREFLGDRGELIPFVGSLFSLIYPETESVSPEVWKVRIHEIIEIVISKLTSLGPTIICFEDLHWADPSSVELVRSLIAESRYPVMFLSLYRPPFSLLTTQQVLAAGKIYKEIQLRDLSLSDARSMLESLLKTDRIPEEIKTFIGDKAEGNPFYLEELINTLIESKVLVRDSRFWKLSRPISNKDIPSGVQGIILARLDRLEKEKKRILQEASVIGRTFLYGILTRITDMGVGIDDNLTGLQSLDLIRTRALQPELEFIFKHSLTQEVVYNGILKKDREIIHEKISRAIEDIYRQRLPEFYESLAFHYNQAHSNYKAIEYLVRSAEKSLSRLALDEAHQHYKDAYDILKEMTEVSAADTALLIDVLLQWSVIFYRRCHFFELIDLLKSHESKLLFLNDSQRTGLFYARLGAAMNWSSNLTEALSYLNKAREIGEKIGNAKVISSAYSFLPWTYSDLGMLDEAIECGRKAQALDDYKIDPDFFRHVSFYSGFAHYFRGDVAQTREMGERILDFAYKNSRRECLSDGYLCLTFSDLNSGDFQSAIGNIKKAYQFALDPLIKTTATTLLAMSYVIGGKLDEAKKTLQELKLMTSVSHSFPHGTVAEIYSGIIDVLDGNLEKGISKIKGISSEYQRHGLKYRYSLINHILGQIYSQLVPGAEGGGKITLSFIKKNLMFLGKTIPFAFGKAEHHFLQAIEISSEIGAKNVLGQAWYDLGLLYRSKGHVQKSRECILRSIEIFDEIQAVFFLSKAKDTLAQFN